jgi:hypothetical protein
MARHKHVAGAEVGCRRDRSGVTGAARDITTGILMQRLERGVRVRPRRVPVPSLMDTGAGDSTGRDQAERQNESPSGSESVPRQHDSPHFVYSESAQ